MSFVEVFWADVEGSQLWKGGWRTKASVLDIFNLVIGDQVLGDAAYGHGKCLVGVSDRR